MSRRVAFEPRWLACEDWPPGRGAVFAECSVVNEDRGVKQWPEQLQCALCAAVVEESVVCVDGIQQPISKPLGVCVCVTEMPEWALRLIFFYGLKSLYESSAGEAREAE